MDGTTTGSTITGSTIIDRATMNGTATNNKGHDQDHDHDHERQHWQEKPGVYSAPPCHVLGEPRCDELLGR